MHNMNAKSLFLIVCSTLLFACGGGQEDHNDPVVLLEQDAGVQTDASSTDSSGDDNGTAPDADGQRDTGGTSDGGGDGDTSGAGQLPPPAQQVWGAAPAEDKDPAEDVVEVDLEAVEKKVTISEGRTLDMYTYNGEFPGPLIEADVGDKVVVNFTNKLPEPTTIHWHGLRIPDEMDGTPRVQAPVKPGESFKYEFTVPEAGSFWYHPHVRSNEQVEKGLYGLFVIRGENEPTYDQERYFTIDDILLDGDQFPPFLRRHPELMHGRYGNILLTNGSPDLLKLAAKQGQVERWRLVNPANARTMKLAIEGAEWRVIGTDGGLLEKPFTTETLELPVGQRYDVEIRYTEATAVKLNSLVRTRDNNGNIVEKAIPLAEVDVEQTGIQPRQVELPTVDIPELDRKPTRTEKITMNARRGGDHGIQWTLNGKANPEEPLFNFKNGETVKIALYNAAGPEHPFHLHGQFFKVVFDGREITDRPGLRDTVLVPGRTTIEIIAYLDNPGQWMAHCHILEHAELGMMSEIVIGE